MVKKLKLIIAAIVGITLLTGVPFTAAAEDFFKGKTLTFVVGFSAGGGFDTYTRLIARHISKHVPGNPRIVVQNRTGAGSLIAANYIYNKAKRDGTVIGNWIGTLLLQEVLGYKAIKFEGRKFNWLGVPTPRRSNLRAGSLTGLACPHRMIVSAPSPRQAVSRTWTTGLPPSDRSRSVPLHRVPLQTTHPSFSK
jgi:hypothetical protein